MATDFFHYQLLENPINQTLSNLSQALQFLVENDFLDGVELNPGEFDEATAHATSKTTENLVQMLDVDLEPAKASIAATEPSEEAAKVEDNVTEITEIKDGGDVAKQPEVVSGALSTTSAAVSL